LTGVTPDRAAARDGGMARRTVPRGDYILTFDNKLGDPRAAIS
jgi:hypothetical protein